MAAESKKAKITIGMAQLNSGDSVENNLRAALRAINELADRGAELIVLPEHADFIGPDSRKKELAQTIEDSVYLEKIRAQAADLKCHIHVGSYLETEDDNVYNCAVVFGPDGGMRARYRKLHLFDVEIPGGKKYLESAIISPGLETTQFSIGEFNFGLATCYDLRFPELFRRLVLNGANVILLPAAFTMQTGRDHWEVLLRARAIENLCWVVGVGQWGEAPPNHLCFGRSMVIDPWGLVVAQAPDGMTNVTADIELQSVKDVRTRFPALDHVREDVFTF
ncbi:MAG: carbon-nitrogen hydrolase family protein [Desulfocapsaceae bacterium]